MFKTHPVDLYDFIYSWKDYGAEVRDMRSLIDLLDLRRVKLLEVACGTGRYLEQFSDCDQIGVDLCERSLEIASRRIPRGRFLHSDMCTMKVDSEADLVLCVFGAYGYLLTDDAQHSGLHAIINALKPGGLLLFQPWIEPDSFVSHETYMQTYKSPNLVITRMVTPRQDGDRSVLSFHFLISRSGFKTEVLQ